MRKSRRRRQKILTLGYAEDESAATRQVQEPLLKIADSSEESLKKIQRNEGYEKIAKVEEGRLILEGF